MNAGIWNSSASSAVSVFTVTRLFGFCIGGPPRLGLRGPGVGPCMHVGASVSPAEDFRGLYSSRPVVSSRHPALPRGPNRSHSSTLPRASPPGSRQGLRYQPVCRVGGEPSVVKAPATTCEDPLYLPPPLFRHRCPNPSGSVPSLAPQVGLQKQQGHEILASIEALKGLGLQVSRPALRGSPEGGSPPCDLLKKEALRELNVLLTVALTKASSPHVLFSRLWRFQAFVTPANGAAALHRLCYLLQQGGGAHGGPYEGPRRPPAAAAAALESPVLQQLLQRLLHRGLRKMSPRHLGMAAWALASLCRLRVSTYSSLKPHQQQQQPILGAHRQTLNLLDSPSLLLGALVEATLKQTKEIAPVGCSSIAWACAVLNDLANNQRQQQQQQQHQQQQQQQHQQQQQQQQQEVYDVMRILKRHLAEEAFPQGTHSFSVPGDSPEASLQEVVLKEGKERREVKPRDISTVLWASARIRQWGPPTMPSMGMLDRETLVLLGALFTQHQRGPPAATDGGIMQGQLPSSGGPPGAPLMRPVDLAMLSEALLVLLEGPLSPGGGPRGPRGPHDSDPCRQPGVGPLLGWGLLKGFSSLGLQQLPAADLQEAAQIVGASRLLHERLLCLYEGAPMGAPQRRHEEDLSSCFPDSLGGGWGASRSEAEAVLQELYDRVDQRLAAAAAVAVATGEVLGTSVAAVAAAGCSSVSLPEAGDLAGGDRRVSQGSIQGFRRERNEGPDLPLGNLVAAAAALAAAGALRLPTMMALGGLLCQRGYALLGERPGAPEGPWEGDRLSLSLHLSCFLAAISHLPDASAQPSQKQQQRDVFLSCVRALAQLVEGPPSLPLQGNNNRERGGPSLPLFAQRQLLGALERAGVSVPHFLQQLDGAAAQMLQPLLLLPMHPWGPPPSQVVRGAPGGPSADATEGWRALVFGLGAFSRLGEPCPRLVDVALAALQQQQQQQQQSQQHRFASHQRSSLPSPAALCSLGLSASARLAWGLALQLPLVLTSERYRGPATAWGPLLAGVSLLLEELPPHLPLLEAAQARQAALALEAAAAAVRQGGPWGPSPAIGGTREPPVPVTAGQGPPRGAREAAEGPLQAAVCGSLKALSSKLRNWEDTLRREAPGRGPPGAPEGSALQREVRKDPLWGAPGVWGSGIRAWG